MGSTKTGDRWPLRPAGRSASPKGLRHVIRSSLLLLVTLARRKRPERLPVADLPYLLPNLVGEALVFRQLFLLVPRGSQDTLPQPGRLEQIAERLEEAEELWEKWDERRRDLAATASELAREIIDLDAPDFSVLPGYRGPGTKLVRQWRRPAEASAESAGIAAAPPERSTLGDAKEITETALERERRRR